MEENIIWKCDPEDYEESLQTWEEIVEPILKKQAYRNLIVIYNRYGDNIGFETVEDLRPTANYWEPETFAEYNGDLYITLQDDPYDIFDVYTFKDDESILKFLRLSTESRSLARKVYDDIIAGTIDKYDMSSDEEFFIEDLRYSYGGDTAVYALLKKVTPLNTNLVKENKMIRKHVRKINEAKAKDVSKLEKELTKINQYLEHGVEYFTAMPFSNYENDEQSFEYQYPEMARLVKAFFKEMGILSAAEIKDIDVLEDNWATDIDQHDWDTILTVAKKLVANNNKTSQQFEKIYKDNFDDGLGESYRSVRHRRLHEELEKGTTIEVREFQGYVDTDLEDDEAIKDLYRLCKRTYNENVNLFKKLAALDLPAKLKAEINNYGKSYIAGPYMTIYKTYVDWVNEGHKFPNKKYEDEVWYSKAIWGEREVDSFDVESAAERIGMYQSGDYFAEPNPYPEDLEKLFSKYGYNFDWDYDFDAEESGESSDPSISVKVIEPTNESKLYEELEKGTTIKIVENTGYFTDGKSATANNWKLLLKYAIAAEEKLHKDLMKLDYPAKCKKEVLKLCKEDLEENELLNAQKSILKWLESGHKYPDSRFENEDWYPEEEYIENPDDFDELFEYITDNLGDISTMGTSFLDEFEEIINNYGISLDISSEEAFKAYYKVSIAKPTNESYRFKKKR